jgi:hypothetical protein
MFTKIFQKNYPKFLHILKIQILVLNSFTFQIIYIIKTNHSLKKIKLSQ